MSSTGRTRSLCCNLNERHFFFHNKDKTGCERHFFPRRKKALSCLNDLDRLYFLGKPWVSSWIIVSKLSCSVRPFVYGKETRIVWTELVTFHHCKSGAIEMFVNALKRNGCTWDAFLGKNPQYGATMRLDFSADLPGHIGFFFPLK